MAEKKTTPKQLPIMVIHYPAPVDYGFVELRIPILWSDFTSTESLEPLAQAAMNISEATVKEWNTREQKKQDARAELKEKAKAEADAKLEEIKKAAVQKIIDDEPDAVMAKRNELGVELFDDEKAAAVIYNERNKATKPTAPKSRPMEGGPSKKKSVSVSEDYEFPEGDYGESCRFFESEFGWNVYLARGSEDQISTVFEWLISIPKEIRHRRDSKYPMISKNGKYIMLNNWEKTIITKAAKAAGMTVSEKLQEVKEE